VVELAALAADIPRPAPRTPPFGPAQAWTQFNAADYPFLGGAVREDGGSARLRRHGV
jgi:hypothetical protein